MPPIPGSVGTSASPALRKAGSLGLFTDLYELTMAASYHARGLDEPATFDLFVRRLPPCRRFLVACGLEQSLDYLEGLCFDDEALGYLSALDMFEDSFLDRLGELRFSGEVWAIPEGEVVFAGEPLLRVTAPMIEAQLVETFLLNSIGHQTMVASKAARVALACGEHPFVDFSARRDQGASAALHGARAAFVAGAAGTSLVLAGHVYGMPVRGTMAHSYVMRFDDESEAYRTFARDLPKNTVLLIDTYDTVEGARRVVEVAKELGEEGIAIQGVRLDSGDFMELAPAVRSVLDEGGLQDVKILASGDLDEHRIAALLAAGMPIDSFGVGTLMGTSQDAPSVDVVYKLVEDADGPKLKLSTGKVTLPGRKQVHRVMTGTKMERDTISLHDEEVAGEPLLERVLTDGVRTSPSPSLDSVRDRFRGAMAALPDRLRVLGTEEVTPYLVETSAGVQELVGRIEGAHRPGSVPQR